eukprot:589231-Alexandrium_andersonii.AAC.1
MLPRLPGASGRGRTGKRPASEPLRKGLPLPQLLVCFRGCKRVPRRISEPSQQPQQPQQTQCRP